MSNSEYNSESIPEEFKKYIIYKYGSFAIKAKLTNHIRTFGRFSSQDVACAATKLLIDHDWDIRDVSKEPLSEYGNYYYVFKVMNNSLIFDSKFELFEKAVEYLEINYKCNDFHNDVFSIKSKKNGYKDRFKSLKIDSSIDSSNDKFDDDYIFKKKDKFIVKKFKSKDSFIFGEFDSYDVARVARKILLDSNWKLNNHHEISFFNNVYWIFDVDGDKLLFKGKSELYEDALDMISPPKMKQNRRPLDIIIENYEEVIKRKKDRKKKQKPKKDLNIKNNVKISRIWDIPFKKIEQNGIPNRIFIQNCDKSENKFFTLDFNFLMGGIQFVVNGVEVNWQKRYDVTIKDFPEFKLIIKILENNNWDLSKIKNSSSIYFYNHFYYKIQVIKDNTIIFDTFLSYALAEKAHLKCIKIHKIHDIICPEDIDKVGDYYELVKFKEGKVYKVNRLKSLEEIKAIRDILMHSNWDFDIFYKYDLFYLNGIYWELCLYGNVVSLIGKFESITIK